MPAITLEFNLSIHNAFIFASRLPTGLYFTSAIAKLVHIDNTPTIHLVGQLSPSNQHVITIPITHEFNCTRS